MDNRTKCQAFCYTFRPGFMLKREGRQKSMAGDVARKDTGSAGVIFSIPDCDYNSEIFPILRIARDSRKGCTGSCAAQDWNFVAMSGCRRRLRNLPVS